MDLLGVNATIGVALLLLHTHNRIGMVALNPVSQQNVRLILQSDHL